MLHCLEQENPHLRTDHPPINVNFETVHNALDSLHLDEGATHVSPSSDRFLCTICVDEPDSPLEQARLPDCSHTFCLPCLASWSVVRQLCPNCKSPFTTILSRRGLDGSAVQGPVDAYGEYPQHEHPMVVLRDAPWLPLREIHSSQHDIEASFELPSRDSAWFSSSSAGVYSSSAVHYNSAESSPAPYYNHEDFEDELEDRFWQEEERAHQSLMRTSRSISNRRYGHGGYLASGRMCATPRLSGDTDGNRPNISNGMNGAESSGKASSSRGPPSSQQASGSKSGHKGKQKSQSHHVGASSSNGNSVPTGRKKKVKKKSRAGIAAAKAAAEKRVNVAITETGDSIPVGASSTASQTNCGSSSSGAIVP